MAAAASARASRSSNGAAHPRRQNRTRRRGERRAAGGGEGCGVVWCAGAVLVLCRQVLGCSGSALLSRVLQASEHVAVDCVPLTAARRRAASIASPYLTTPPSPSPPWQVPRSPASPARTRGSRRGPPGVQPAACRVRVCVLSAPPPSPIEVAGCLAAQPHVKQRQKTHQSTTDTRASPCCLCVRNRSVLRVHPSPLSPCWPAVVELYREWAGPCKPIASALRPLAYSNSAVKFVAVRGLLSGAACACRKHCRRCHPAPS